MKADTLPVPGSALYYEVRGSGPVLLMISGGPMDAGGFRAVAERLADAHHDAALDLPLLWAVGTFVNPATGNNETLILRSGATGWTIVGGPNPGSGSNILGRVAASGKGLWAVGLYDNGGSNLPLIERHPS